MMKKILIISTVPTHPVNAGNRTWIKDSCELLKKLGYDVHFLYVYIKPRLTPETESIDQTRNYWGEKFHLYRASFVERYAILIKIRLRLLFNQGYIKCDDKFPFFLQKKVQTLIKKYDFDICIVQYFYLTKIFDSIKGPVKVLATHDNFAYKDLVVNQRVVDCIDANQSAKAMQRSDVILSLNSDENVFFKMLSPKSRVYTVYSYYEYHPQLVAGNRNILFLSGGNPFSVNGLNWFLSKIFPLITKRFPDCKLVIGGAICSKIKHLEGNRNIIIQGYVDDVEEFYKQGDICINPTYQGTGLKTKTFEAVSYDKIEIAHPHSAIGIYSEEKAPILFSSKAEDWLREIEIIWMDKEEIVKRKEKNREYIESLQKYVIDQYSEFLGRDART